MRASSFLVLTECSALLSLLLTGCRNDGGITKHDASPTATILAPVDGAVLREGDGVELSGQVGDADDDLTTLTATWFVNSVPVCEPAVDPAGAVSCTWIASDDGALVELLVTDPSGSSGQDSAVVSTIPNAPPVLTLLHPSDGDVLPMGELVALDGSVQDDVDVPSDIALTWTLDEVEVDPGATVDDAGVIAGYLAVDPGEHVLVVTATDLQGATSAATAAFTVSDADLGPDCQITSDDGGASALGSPVTFTGLVGDAETAPDALLIAWSSDIDGAFGSGRADSSGLVSVTTSALSAGTHSVLLTVTDAAGNTCADSVAWRVAEAPDVLIDLPVDGETVGEGDLVQLSGEVSDLEDLATDLEIEWASDIDGMLSSAGADSSGRVAASVDTLSPGEHVISLTAVDSDGLYTTASVLLTVDGRPDAPSVSLDPSAPGTADDLTVRVTADAVDPEGAPIRYRYEWYADGVLSAASTSATLPADATTRGETWRVDVYPSDGTYEGPPGEASVVIGNTAPVVTTPVITPDPAYASDTLTCAASASDVDGDAVSLAYAWVVDGTPSGSDPTLSGADLSHHPGVQCCVTGSDGADATLACSAVLSVHGSAPVATSVTLTPGAPGTDDVVTASYTYTDADGDSVSAVRYDWYVNGAVVAASGATLDGRTSFARGDSVAVEVTLSDAYDDGVPLRSATITVGDTAPTLASVTLAPSPATESSTLTCTAGAATDADGDAVTLAYAWDVSGRTPSATGATLTGADFARGDTVRCTVTPSDGTLAGAPVASSAVTIDDTAPAEATVTLSPSPVRTNDVLTATASASDVDGDPVTWSYRWTRNGGRVATTGNTLDGAGSFDKGDTLEVSATPSDGTRSGTAATASIVVVNTPPTLGSVSLSPASPHEDDALTCFTGATADADGDTVTLAYRWEVNGATIAASTSSLTGSAFSHGDTVQCFVTPNDGEEDGAELATGIVTVLNSAPTGTSVTLSPASPATNDVLTAVTSAADVDGDALSWTYAWYRNGSHIAASGPTLNGATWFDKGDTVEVVVVPSDGAASGPSVRSAAVTVVNSAPGAPVVEIQPADPIEALDDLLCVVTTPASDADGDAVSYAAAWTVDGSAFGGTTSTSFSGDTVSADDTVAEEEWVCTVTATDASAARSTASDSLFVLGNPVNYAHVQYPCSGSAAAGSAFDVYTWLYEPAVTQGPGMGVGIDVEVGVGPDGSDPATDGGWTWFAATYNADKDGPYPGDEANDEYRATLTAPSTPGSYDYAARATTDHGLSYLYIDLGGDTCRLIGTTDGYEPTSAGALTVY